MKGILMKRSMVFLAALDDIWEHACKLKFENRRSDGLQPRNWTRRATAGPFCRRRSDQIVGERRSRRSGALSGRNS